MVILNQALLEIRTAMSSAITEAQAGTGTTLPSPSDTALESPVADTLNTTSNSLSDSPPTIYVTHVITTPEAIGENLSEWEIRINIISDISFNRTVTSPLIKNGTQEVTRITTIEVTQG